MADGDKQQRDEVLTASRVQMWWLSWFRGYRVTSIHRRPVGSSLGRVVYLSTWRLEREDDAEAAGD